MLDIDPSCNHVQYQGKLMMQTCKIAKNLISSPILGPQNFFRGFYLTVASYHRMQFEGKPMIQLNQIPNAQTISLQIFKGCLPQILLGPFLNTLSQLLKKSLTENYFLYLVVALWTQNFGNMSLFLNMTMEMGLLKIGYLQKSPSVFLYK